MVSSKAKMTSSGGLDIRQVKDLPLITPLKTKQVNSKLIAARDFPLYLSHPRENKGTLFFLESTKCKTIITVRTIKSINQSTERLLLN